MKVTSGTSSRDLGLQGLQLGLKPSGNGVQSAVVSGGVKAQEEVDRQDRLAGVLLGTAIGDALGLPMEGMPATAIARRFERLDRYQLLGARGFVSDDTEQSALVAQCLARHPADRAAFVRSFRRAILGWFLRLPWGIGLGTLKACLRIALGLRRSGVGSAGNGAAMRAAIVGAFFADDPAKRREWCDELARTTHVDPRAVEGARFVAELAARCVRADFGWNLDDLVVDCLPVVEDSSLKQALTRALELARNHATIEVAAKELGVTGFVVHTLGITTFAFLSFGATPLRAVTEVIRAGGDTDSHAAIVGAWMGALHGERGLPAELTASLHDSDWIGTKAAPAFCGPTHLRALARSLEAARAGSGMVTAYSWPGALLRNLALYPVVLWHALRVAFARG
jgi:ADP-ribosyl-[dinitrogen reductase] hydrolase